LRGSSLYSKIGNLTIWLYVLLPIFGFFSFEILGVPPAYPLVFIMSLLFLPYLFKQNLIFSRFSKFFLIYIAIEFTSKYVLNGYSLLKGENYLFYSAQLIIVFLIILIIDNTRFTHKAQKGIYRFMGYFLWAAAIVSILQFVIDPNFLTRKAGEEVLNNLGGNRRVLSFFGWEGEAKGAMVSIPLIGIILLNRQAKFAIRQIVLIVLPVFFVTFLTGSRAAIIATLLMIFFNSIRFGVSRFIGVSIFLLAVVSFGLSIINFNFDSFVEGRLQEDTDSRTVIFSYAFAKINDSPLLGDGRTGVKGFEDDDLLSSNYNFGNRVHNGFLKIMLNYGIIGLIVFILLFIEMQREGRRVYRLTGDTSYRYFVIMLLFLNFTVDIVNFFYPGIFLIWWHSHNLKMKAANLVQ